MPSTSRIIRKGADGGCTWLDTGTPDFLLEAAEFVRTIDKRQGLKIASAEEIAYRSRWISAGQSVELANALGRNSYSEYLLGIANNGIQ